MSDFESKMGKGLAYGLGVGAAGAAGVGIAENQKKYQAEKDLATKAEEKAEEIKRSQKPQDGGGPESTARPLARKKGGLIKTFRHHDGIAQRGKTRA